MGARLAGWRRLLKRFSHCRRGNVAMMFALSLPLLAMTSLVGVDVHRISTVRANLQDALDAAALAAARSPHMDDAGITTVGMASLRANLQAYPQIALREDLTNFHLTDQGAVIADAKVDVETLVANIFLPPYGQLLDDQVQVGVTSEVLRSSNNLEVALVVDVTGSMAGSKLTALQDAANELVDLVVQDRQTPYYSKVSLVPYAMSVNLGPYAAAVRGPNPMPFPISGAAWMTGSARAISGVSRNSSGLVTVTAANHGLQTGHTVYISDLRGAGQINGRVFEVTRVDSNRVRLSGTVQSLSNYQSGGRISRCLTSGCDLVFTAEDHGLQNNDTARIQDVRGLAARGSATPVAGSTFRRIMRRDANTFYFRDEVFFGPNYGAYESGGAFQCDRGHRNGCSTYVFTSAYWGNENAFDITTCASERTGDEAFTDAAPSREWLGRVYAGSGNPCPSAQVIPLTSNRTSLHDAIDDLEDGGSTAGHLGLAWGWYTLSPNFNGVWTGESQAAAYGTRQLMKVLIFMTDGEFNTVFCDGVISRSSTSGSGSTSDQIACDAPNGSSFDQTDDLCDAIKDEGVIIYAVGFDLPARGDARNALVSCASDPSHVFLPDSGSDLREAFRAIARSISDLRIAR